VSSTVAGHEYQCLYGREASMMPPLLFNAIDSFMQAMLFLFVFVFGLVAILYRMVMVVV
jgi:hypothetical protein